jgi:putative ABC transport system substrate-binding protein
MPFGQVKRREFISLLGATATWPLAARAQQLAERMRRIAVLEETAQDDVQRNREFAKFQDGLVSFGWVEGRTVRIDHRFAAADARQYAPLARELAALKPEVILGVSTPVIAILQRETPTISVVWRPCRADCTPLLHLLRSGFGTSRPLSARTATAEIEGTVDPT